MPIPITSGAPVLLIRREAYERSGLQRAAIDQRLGLTDDEFRVEGGLVVIGAVLDEVAFGQLLVDFEELGLRHYDDFFDLSGNWPPWLKLFATAETEPS